MTPLHAALAVAGLPVARRIAVDTVELSDGRRISGWTGADWLHREPEAAPEIAAALGASLKRLWTVAAGPSHDWPDRWRARLRDARAQARRRRLDLGPPLDAALATAGLLPEHALPPAVPVHGDLDLDRLWLDRSLTPVTLLGLEDASPGDGLVDLAAALRFTDPALRVLVAEAADLRREPGVEARLGAYLRGDLLTHLLRAPDAPADRARHQERVRLRLDEVTDPRGVLSAPHRREPDHPVLAARQALEAIGAGAPLDGPSWLGALGASLLGASLPLSLGARYGLVARELAGRPGSGSGPADAPPHPGVRFLVTRAIALVEDAVGAHVREGMEAACRHASPAADALLRAREVMDQPPIDLGLPPELLGRVVDDPLDGARASLPAIAWAGQVLATRGYGGEARRRLEEGLAPR